MLERAAIEGEIFHRGAVQALMPDELRLSPRLAALVRKELISPDRAQLAGEDAFRFRHLLIRDAAYDTLPKSAESVCTRATQPGWRSGAPSWSSRTRFSAITSSKPAATAPSSGCPVDESLAEEATATADRGGHRAYVRSDFDAVDKPAGARRRTRP